MFTYVVSHQMRLQLIVLLVAFSLCTTPVHAADEHVSVHPTISVIAYDTAGNVVFENGFQLQPGWMTLQIGDPLTLSYAYALSLHKQEERADETPNKEQRQLSEGVLAYQITVKAPETDSSNGSPVRPDGCLYAAQLPDGGCILTRMAADPGLASVVARYKDQDIELVPIDPVEAAQLQVRAKAAAADPDSQLLEFAISACDNRSLLASRGLLDPGPAMFEAARVLQKTLELFYEEEGQYPFGLCELYKGERAIVGDLPRNPSQFERNLSESEFSQPRPQYAVRYFPEILKVTDGANVSEIVIGYWLAVLGPGVQSMPQQPLPLDSIPPMRAIAWLEHHPDPADAPAESQLQAAEE